MEHDDFHKLVERRLSLTKEVMIRKNGDYSAGDNKLYNFYHAASMKQVSAPRALDYMKLKHEVSVADMIDDFDKGIIPTQERVDEKIGDLINYLILLEALYEDARNQKETVTVKF